MNFQTYEEIFKIWSNRKPNESIWTIELAVNYGFTSSEALRSAFRRAKKLFGKGQNVVKAKIPKKINTGAKILLFDIETSPINALIWGIWDQNVHIDAILQDWHLLGWSAKWLFDDNTMSDVLTPNEAKNHDDKRIFNSIWPL